MKLIGRTQKEVDDDKSRLEQESVNSKMRADLSAGDWKIVRAMEVFLINQPDIPKGFTKKEWGELVNHIKDRRDLRTQVK